MIIAFAMYLKSGLLGCYAPYYALWLHVHHYSAHEIGYLAIIDNIASILFMPTIGLFLDRYKVHNAGLSIIMMCVAVFNTLYLPLAQYFG